ncbi:MULTISPECIES: hypothetical protein [unclassified Nitratiruptor]|uniref:hypothetical protein n=1 Tax=unclassified Nitratiruptor TaxID=2624044 RepID=UPI001915CD6A|nr:MULTISPECIES: hypothetical protein [unclassified Nitratiruptor]
MMPENFSIEEVYRVYKSLEFPTTRLWNEKRRKKRKAVEQYKKRKKRKAKKHIIDIYV